MKYLNKHNNMISSMYKCSGLRREPKKIKKIRAKASKKNDYSTRNISSSNSYSSLSSDSEWYRIGQIN